MLYLMKSRRVRISGLLVSVLASAGCQDMLLNDPAPAVAGLAVSYTLADAAGPTEGPLADHAPFDGARVAVFGEDESLLAEETVDLSGSLGEEKSVQLVVPMEEDFRTVRVAVELLSHGEVVASGSAEAAVELGTTTEVGIQLDLDDCGFQSEISAVECRALVALYNSTNGPGWTNSTGWLSNTPCSWHGVRCEQDRVTSLSLIFNQLTGSIPAELGNLSNLENLLIGLNQLTGSIPAELGNLSSLRSMNLGSNRLTGSIPSELANLPRLGQLSLHDNELTGSIPAALGDLSTLRSLTLNQNQLTGSIPAELGNLTDLGVLILFENQLTGQVPIEVARVGGQIDPPQECQFAGGNEGLFMPDTQEYRDADLDDDGVICGLTLGA